MAKKSETQICYDNAKLIIRIILSVEKNEDDIQMHLVKQFYMAFHNDNIRLAYNIINESFNQNLIAGYKYLECCKLCEVRGEFYEIAIKNPLINL